MAGEGGGLPGGAGSNARGLAAAGGGSWARGFSTAGDDSRPRVGPSEVHCSFLARSWAAASNHFSSMRAELG